MVAVSLIFTLVPVLLLLGCRSAAARAIPSQKYSFSLTTFGPDGSLTQLEHALQAVSEGTVCVGVSSVDGVILASPSAGAGSKEELPLLKRGGVSKVVPIAAGTGLGYAGLAADFRFLASRAQQFTKSYLQTYGEEEGVSIQALVQSLARCMQEHTQQAGVRPFGVSLLLGGADGSLWRLDPSGVASPWLACAVGKNAAQAEKILEREFKPNMTRVEARQLALKAVRAAVGDEDLDDTEVELIFVGEFV